MSLPALSSQARRPAEVRFWRISFLALILSLFSTLVGPLGAQESA